MMDNRTFSQWWSLDSPNVRPVTWPALIPSSACFVLAMVAVLCISMWPGSRLLPLAASACAASAAVSMLVAIGIAQQLRTVVRQRDAFYQEFSRLSKLASLGEASCSIAHDLNNPLAIMNEEAGWLQDLLDATDTDPDVTRREFTASVEQVQIQIGRCREIARRMLTWTREPEEPSGQVDVNLLLTKTLYLVETELVATGVRVVRQLAAELPFVRGSSADLRQVFLHLMKNALDAMKGTGGTLTIMTRRAGGRVRVTIADTGPGIQPEALSRIFEPFFTTKGEELGTGLGLTISLWIVQRIDGRIEVESTPGLGSAFHVTLPTAEPRERPAHNGGTA